MAMGLGGCQGSDCEGCCGNGHSRAKKERENTEVAMEKSTDFILILFFTQNQTTSNSCFGLPRKRKRIQNLFQLDPTNLPESGRTGIYWSVCTCSTGFPNLSYIVHGIICY